MPPLPYQGGRDRFGRARRRKRMVRRGEFRFINPYPWMSEVEAIVHLFLEMYHIPFTWRYFDGKDLAPELDLLIPDYTPEFTLREYKIVIIILGNYFSTLPGVIDKQALAQAALEYDGWKVAMLWEDEIRTDVSQAIFKNFPELINPAILGPARTNPWGIRPTYLATRRAFLSAYNLLRTKVFKPSESKEKKKHVESGPRGKRKRRRFRDRRTRLGD